MFQLSLFTEFGRLCNPFDYVLGFTFLLMAYAAKVKKNPSKSVVGRAPAS